MKKILIILPLILILCGCSANYEIEIKDNKIYENLTIVETNKELFDVENDSGWTMRDSFDALIYDDEFSYQDYKIESLENSERIGIKYSRRKVDSIIDSSVINQCYTNSSVITEENIVVIDTGNEFTCYEFYDTLDSIKVVFKTNHKVISTNADLEKNGSYIWNITNDGNKRIQISYDKSITKPNFIMYIVLFLIFITIGVLAYFIVKKLKRRNSF